VAVAIGSPASRRDEAESLQQLRKTQRAVVAATARHARLRRHQASQRRQEVDQAAVEARYASCCLFCVSLLHTCLHIALFWLREERESLQEVSALRVELARLQRERERYTKKQQTVSGVAT
jgi:hypothetical protein